jgi:hypothetical protein
MGTAITTNAREKGTYVVTLTFTDEDSNSVVPDSIAWTLLNRNSGTVINSREDVAIATPAASVDVVLSGDDLQILTDEEDYGRRVLLVEAVYDSSAGNNLPLKTEAYFQIDDLAGVT